MKFTIQVLIETAESLPLTLPIQTIDRPCESIEEVGLQIAEAKSILKGLQENVVRQQLAEFLAPKRLCPHCQRSRATKGSIRCDSGAPTVMCYYGAPDGIAANASIQPKRRTAP
jgi:hypothetical protein